VQAGWSLQRSPARKEANSMKHAPLRGLRCLPRDRIGSSSGCYWFLSIAQSALLLLIVWYAWTWPTREGTP
jgi:hypothetical protein